MMGQNMDSEEDQEAMDMLVFNAQKLNQVKQKFIIFKNWNFVISKKDQKIEQKPELFVKIYFNNDECLKLTIRRRFIYTVQVLY